MVTVVIHEDERLDDTAETQGRNRAEKRTLDEPRSDNTGSVYILNHLLRDGVGNPGILVCVVEKDIGIENLVIPVGISVVYVKHLLPLSFFSRRGITFR